MNAAAGRARHLLGLGRLRDPGARQPDERQAHGARAEQPGEQRAPADRRGNLRPCNHTPTVLGNVWQTPFWELATGPRMAEFAAAIPLACAPCPRRVECQGGCKAAAQACYGSLTAEEPFLKSNTAWNSPGSLEGRF